MALSAFEAGSLTAIVDLWRRKLAVAQQAYDSEPTLKTKAEFRRVLRIFTDLVLEGQRPPTG